MAQNSATALQWLKENPDDKNAPKVRENLRKLGIDVPDPAPTGVTGYAEAIGQGAVLDPLESVGQMAEKLPGAPGRWAQQAGDWFSKTFPSAQKFLDESKQAGESHPVTRTLSNIAPWLLVPGAGESALARAGIDVGLGALGGATQPLDPKDKNFWRDKAVQAGLGGALGGGLGAIGGRVANRQAAQRAYDAAEAFRTATPERATRAMYDRIAAEAHDPSLVPTTITPSTAADVRSRVGGLLNRVYAGMSFDPMTPGWVTSAGSIYRTMRSTLTNPAMQERWDRVFANDAFTPILREGRAGPISGEKLNQLVSDLGARANEFGLASTTDKAFGDQWRLMAEGMRRIQQTLTRQIDAANPALGAERRALNRAYHIADMMMDATSATRGGIADPARIAGAWERKTGKPLYASPRFSRSKQMLERERQTQATPVPQPPGPSPVGQAVGRAAAHLGSAAAAHHLGLGWPGYVAGSGLVEVARQAGAGRAAADATRRLGSRPGAVGAAAGQTPDVTFDILSIEPGSR